MIIWIEGLTAIGKTWLANILHDHYEIILIEQDFQRNPFFPSDVSDITKDAIERELIFLILAYNQLKDTTASGKPIITDFMFRKLRCFAEVCLTQQELINAYYPIFNYLQPKVPEPDYVIYLSGSPSFAAKNALERKRSNETQITVDALSQINVHIERLMKEIPREKVLEHNVEKTPIAREGKSWEQFENKLLRFIPYLSQYKRIVRGSEETSS